MNTTDHHAPVNVANIVPTLNLLDEDEVLQRARDFPDRLIIELLENNEFEYALPLIQKIIAEERGDILEALAEDSATHLFLQLNSRSEERRVGKEGREREEAHRGRKSKHRSE